MALALHNRPTDVPTAAPETSSTATSMQAPPGEPHPLVTGAKALGAGAGAMIGAAGPGGPSGQAVGALFGVMLSAMVGAVLWMNARVSQAEEAYRAATDRLGGYDSRLVKIELTLEEYASAAQELPEIRKSLDRLVDDQRMTAGALASIERVLREEKTP